MGHSVPLAFPWLDRKCAPSKDRNYLLFRVISFLKIVHVMHFSLLFLLSKLFKNLPSPYSPNFMFLFSEKKKINANMYIEVHTKVLFVLTNSFWTLACLEYSFWYTIHCQHFPPSILYCGFHFQATLFCYNGWICQSNAYYLCVYISYIHMIYINCITILL